MEQLFSTMHTLLKPQTHVHRETTEKQCYDFMSLLKAKMDDICTQRSLAHLLQEVESTIRIIKNYLYPGSHPHSPGKDQHRHH